MIIYKILIVLHSFDFNCIHYELSLFLKFIAFITNLPFYLKEWECY